MLDDGDLAFVSTRQRWRWCWRHSGGCEPKTIVFGTLRATDAVRRIVEKTVTGVMDANVRGVSSGGFSVNAEASWSKRANDGLDES